MTITEQTRFNELVDIASNETGPTRPSAYAEAMEQLRPALTELARAHEPTIASVQFAMNYTDEGAYLTLDDCRDSAGDPVTVNPDVFEEIDQMVFVLTGEAEDGTGIPGMTKTGDDLYQLQL